MLDFSVVTETAVLLDPAGQRQAQQIEHRTDPLTGTVASFNLALGEKAKVLLGTADLAMLGELEEKSKTGCPFCAAADKGTRYPPEHAPHFPGGGQLRRGGTVAMPNLFSKCAIDSVVILDTGRHVLFPSKIGREGLANAVTVSADVVRRARALGPSLLHHVVGMNFLQPGGSSVPHPHFQVHVRAIPFSGVARTLQAAEGFRQRTGRGYFDVLLEEERALGTRLIGQSGDRGQVQWLAPFAPAHQKEVWGVLPGCSSLAALDDAGCAAFAEGVDKVISAYEASGAHPFTFAFFSSPSPDDAAGFALHLRLCARPAFRALYSNFDTWFTPKFIGDDVHTEAPEQVAARLRARW